mmetsp:Transcript_545/g.905  ORF Transcript_545/g.905 Transcript_545/m.905 type:complete len:290 (-) Transcript_545:528-1397(-)
MVFLSLSSSYFSFLCWSSSCSWCFSLRVVSSWSSELGVAGRRARMLDFLDISFWISSSNPLLQKKESSLVLGDSYPFLSSSFWKSWILFSENLSFSSSSALFFPSLRSCLSLFSIWKCRDPDFSLSLARDSLVCWSCCLNLTTSPSSKLCLCTFSCICSLFFCSSCIFAFMLPICSSLFLYCLSVFSLAYRLCSLELATSSSSLRLAISVSYCFLISLKLFLSWSSWSSFWESWVSSSLETSEGCVLGDLRLSSLCKSVFWSLSSSFSLTSFSLTFPIDSSSWDIFWIW